MGEEVIKKKRGNPNWIKGVKRNGQKMSKQNSTKQEQSTNNNTTMAEEETRQIPEKTETTSENGKANIPSDIFSDEIPKEEVLPLDEEVKENPYAAIPESADTSSSSQAASGESKEPSASATSPDSPQAAVQASVSPEQRQHQAEMTVDLMFKGYEKLHGLGRMIGKIDENELMQLHVQGKINLEQELPIGRKKLKVGEFFGQYNQSINDNIVVTEEFKDSVRPALTRIAIKRGWFVSDELYVGLIVGEDLATKVGMLIGLKKSANLVIKACMEMTKNQNKKNQQEQPEPVEVKTEMPETNESDWKEEPPATS